MMRFLCQVSSDVKFTTFRSTTTLQRCKLLLWRISPAAIVYCLLPFPFISSFTIEIGLRIFDLQFFQLMF